MVCLCVCVCVTSLTFVFLVFLCVCCVALRRRVDSLKYDMKKVEGVVYDVSLRGLVGSKARGGEPIKRPVQDPVERERDIKRSRVEDGAQN